MLNNLNTTTNEPPCSTDWFGIQHQIHLEMSQIVDDLKRVIV